MFDATASPRRRPVRQLLLNLLTNAGDAMPEGGTLTLRAAAGTLAGGAPGVVVEVADTGIGIAPEDLPKVMEPFFTTKPDGRGTVRGLAICRRIVEGYQGRLEITNEAGKGTVVRITLPAPSRGG